MKVSVVIVTFNPKKWIDKCFNSLKQSSTAVQTIVVDNNSTDGSLDLIRMSFPEVTVIELNENLGFGKGNNIGIKKAYDNSADYVFLLNQDAWIEPDTITKLIEAHQKDQQYGIVSPMHLNGNGDALDHNFSTFIIPSKCKGLYSDIFLKIFKNEIYETAFVNAAAWLISKKCLETVGGFNPSFSHYGEDDNYVQRVKYHHLKIGVFPNSIIYHDRDKQIDNVYFNDIKKAYTRTVILKISNPFTLYSFNQERFKCYRSLIKSLLSFKISKAKNALLKVRILNNINEKEILANKKETRISKANFLN